MELDRYDFILVVAAMTAFAIIGLHHLPMWVRGFLVHPSKSVVLWTPSQTAPSFLQ